MRDKILKLIEKLEKNHDFESEFYLVYTGQLEECDICDWDGGNFDDSVSLGFSTGEASMAEQIIVELKKIIGDDK